mgnify:FL=1
MSLKINTNLSSLTVQSNLKNSTASLNKAIERMTSGFKINNAKDNAANYSIATSLTTKINAYSVAEDNASTGLDLLETASSSLNLISDKLARLRALQIQTSNDTYGDNSLEAINKEANSIVSEIGRLYNTTEYNGIKLFGDTNGSFIEKVNRRDTSGMTKLAAVSETQALAKGTYSISSAEELAKLAEMQNKGLITDGSEFVLGGNIDLSDYSSGNGWTAIGTDWYTFASSFDGNGYKISNLKISGTQDMQGLFYGLDNGGTIKNVSLENADVSGGSSVGALVGSVTRGTINNCNASGSVTGTGFNTGGLLGSYTYPANLENCYANVDVKGNDSVGGLVGNAGSNTIKKCFATGNVTGSADRVGGLVGAAYNTNIENCYATGKISGTSSVGGLVGIGRNIADSYATGKVTGAGANVGGLAGKADEITSSYAKGDVINSGRYTGGLVGNVDNNSNITDCHATGNVTVTGSNQYVGGIVGNTAGNLTNCYATGDITATASQYVGGLAGYSMNSNSTLANCYAKGNVSGRDEVGGLIGQCYGMITDSHAYGDVIGASGNIGGLTGTVYSRIQNSSANGNVKSTGSTGNVGGLVGSSSNTGVSNCYATGDVSGGEYAGGLVGVSTTTINKSYSLGKVSGANNKGGLVGGGSISSNDITDGYYNQAKNGTSGLGTAASTSTIDGLVANGTLKKYDTKNPTRDVDKTFDMSSDANKSIDLQVGIDGTENSRLTVNTGLTLAGLENLRQIGATNKSYLQNIDTLLAAVTSKQTEFGAIQNRLESALEAISVSYDNLVSSRSTIRDADIATESSAYIRSQILQQASATLLATANQAPSVALQLI